MSVAAHKIRTPYQYAEAYVENNWIIIENTDPDSKNPNRKRWNELSNCIRTVLQIPESIERIGLANYYSGIAIIDIDDLVAARAWFADVEINIDEYLNAPDAVHLPFIWSKKPQQVTFQN